MPQRDQRKAPETVKEVVQTIGFEQKVLTWFRRHWMWPVILLAGVVIFWGSGRVHAWLKEKQDLRLLALFSDQKTLANKLEWAKQELPASLNGLRGFVFLESANDAYTRGNFEMAAEFYGKAVGYLNLSPLLEHAQRGYAFSALHTKDYEKGKQMFELLAKNNLNYIRAESLYALGFLAARSKNWEEFERHTNDLGKLQEGEHFFSQLKALKNVSSP